MEYTARRELAEEGGLTITACPEWTYHPESKAQNVVFYAETCEEPSPNEKEKIKSVTFVAWRVYTASGLPSELHPRIKVDKGYFIKKKLMELSKRVGMHTSKTPKRQRTNGEETITTPHHYVAASVGGDSGESVGGMEDNMGMCRPATTEGDYAKEDLCGEICSDVGGAASNTFKKEGERLLLDDPRDESSIKQNASLTFVGAVVGYGWKQLAINSEYVPAIGTTYGLGLTFEPIPSQKDVPGHLLALAMPCGRGKSIRFREYMQSFLVQNPRSRVLMLSANILYGTNLAHELKQSGFDVAFYKEKDVTLSTHQVVVCSLESLHQTDDQRFELLFIDEVRTIATIVGGETMQDFSNLSLLARICTQTARIIVCDADLLYKADDSEPFSSVHDFLQIITGTRQVFCSTLNHPGPPHLHRKVRLFYDYSKEYMWGKRQWMNEVEHAAAAWHADHEHRFAICVGSKGQLRKVANLLYQLRVAFKPFSGETGAKGKLGLIDPDAAFRPYGCILSTTTLSIGVDPKSVQFSRVFVWTCRTGCNVLAQMQAAMRFGRSDKAPLLNTTIDILLDCIPPAVRGCLVLEKKCNVIVPPSYSDELLKLQKRRGMRVNMWTRTMQAQAGSIDGVSQPALVSDAVLRLMAHGSLERICQMSNMDGAVKRVCAHHGWEIVAHPLLENTNLFTADLEGVEIDEDDAFATLKTEGEKFELVLQYVMERGEEEFFENCYGLTQEKGSLSAQEMWVVKAFWLLRALARLPSSEDTSDGGEEGLQGDSVSAAALQLVAMNKPGVFAGLQLNALRRCITAEEQMKRDNLKRLCTDKKLADPFLSVSIGIRMSYSDDCASLLGIQWITSECELPARIVDIANRETEKKLTTGDKRFIAQLQAIGCALQGCSGEKLIKLLNGIAKACSMKLVPQTCRPRNGTATRTRIIENLKLKRCMPSIVDDWIVKSDRLECGVRTLDWAEAHLHLDEEELQRSIECDPELDDSVYGCSNTQASPDEEHPSHLLTGIEGVRQEKLDGVALHAELNRLRKKGTPSARDDRHLSWLEAVDKSAHPRPVPGSEPPKVRWLTVTYGKMRAFGRQYASYPSMQNCPKTLRPLLAGPFCSMIDVVNCHPTLHLQVAVQLGVTSENLKILKEYVNQRNAVLKRIGEFYGVEPSKCKFLVLRVLNGGSPMAWIKESNCTRNQTQLASDIIDLQEVARDVHSAFLQMPQYQGRIAALAAQLRVTTKAKVARAVILMHAANGDEERDTARYSLEKARSKATRKGIQRSIFSFCCFELEDTILRVIDEYLNGCGWTVQSLIFDAVVVLNRPGGSLRQAMRGAEEAVKRKLGYTIELSEEALSSVSDPYIEADEEDKGEDP